MLRLRPVIKGQNSVSCRCKLVPIGVKPEISLSALTGEKSEELEMIWCQYLVLP